MNRSDLERAWPATEPSPGFSERVLERVQTGPIFTEPQPRRASGAERAPSSWGWLAAHHPSRWAIPVVVLALGAVFLFWPTRSAQKGDVIAAEPRVLSIGERVVAEMSSGAHIRWSGDEVQQDSGEVTYRVVPGPRFRVQTPYGSVAVLGTVFRVGVANGEQAEGEPMKKQWAIAGASATLGALLFVSVDTGRVSLSKGEHELLLGSGQSGVIGSDGIPRATGAGTAVPAARSVPPAVGTSREPPAAVPHPYEPRPMTEGMRERRRRVLESPEARQPVAKPAAAAAKPQSMKDRTGKMGPEVKALNEQFGPLVDQCFDQAKERGVRGHGMLALQVKLAGADGIGRIIESVEPAPSNAIHDGELIDCVRQSAFTVDLPPPTASGTSEVMLTIPFEGAAGAADAGAPTSYR